MPCCARPCAWPGWYHESGGWQLGAISEERLLRISRVLILTGLVLPLAGCKLLPTRAPSCSRPGGYEAAQNMPPLKVPAGLDAPDTKASLPIPTINEPEKPRQPGDPCLDEPPRYSPAKDAKPAR